MPRRARARYALCFILEGGTRSPLTNRAYCETAKGTCRRYSRHFFFFEQRKRFIAGPCKEMGGSCPTQTLNSFKHLFLNIKSFHPDHDAKQSNSPTSYEAYRGQYLARSCLASQSQRQGVGVWLECGFLGLCHAGSSLSPGHRTPGEDILSSYDWDYMAVRMNV